MATAISEVARNIVRFARRGEITLCAVADGDVPGVSVVARTPDRDRRPRRRRWRSATTTYGGRGIGLPGCKAMMDEFEISSETGRGTTVTMTKWRRM